MIESGRTDDVLVTKETSEPPDNELVNIIPILHKRIEKPPDEILAAVSSSGKADIKGQTQQGLAAYL